jgi:hypothetical protein
MVEKTEWEVVDDGASRPREAPRTPKDAAASLLGPWWKWKLTGAVAVALAALAFFAAVIGIVVLSVAALAVAIAALGKFMHWLRGPANSRGTSVSRR